MRAFKVIFATVLALALLLTGGCDKILSKLPGMSPTVSPSVEPTTTPSVEPTTTPTTAPTPVWRPTSGSHLKELLNFADPDSIKLFSLGWNNYRVVSYRTEFTGQYKLITDDLKAKDGCSVEIFIDSGDKFTKIHDLVQIDMTALGITLGEIGEIYIDFMMMDGDQLHNWWPRVTVNGNESGTFDGNTISSWRADGMSSYSSDRGEMSYSLITHAEIMNKCGRSEDIAPEDYFEKLGFQFYVEFGQHATFRVDSITIKTLDEVGGCNVDNCNCGW